jgi:hypothetical protein
MNQFMEVEIKVNGIDVKANIREELEIADISDDMNKVASQMAFWGSVWASAEQEAAAAEAYYRKWRAETGKVIAAKNDKLAEWKIRQMLESKEEFHTIKIGMANAAQNIIVAKTLYEAFKTKASMLQSKGAMLRAELDSTSMRTPSASTSRRAAENEERRASNKEQMKKIFRSKKSKTVSK